MRLSILRESDATHPTTLAGPLTFGKLLFAGVPDPKTYAVINYPESKVRVEKKEIKAGDLVLATINEDADGNLVVNIKELPEEFRKIARDLLIQVSEKDCVLTGRKLFNNAKRFHVVRVGNSKNYQIKDYEDLSDATKLIYTEFFKNHQVTLGLGTTKDTELITLKRTDKTHETILANNKLTPVIFDPAKLQITINDRLAECLAVRDRLVRYMPPPAPNRRDGKYEKVNGMLTPKGNQLFRQEFAAWEQTVAKGSKDAAQKNVQLFNNANLSSLNPNWEKKPPNLQQFASWLDQYKKLIVDAYQVIVIQDFECTIQVTINYKYKL